MEMRLKTWEARKKQGDRDICLTVSIVDIKEDIKTIKRAMRLQEQYHYLIHGEEKGA